MPWLSCGTCGVKFLARRTGKSTFTHAEDIAVGAKCIELKAALAKQGTVGGDFECQALQDAMKLAVEKGEL